MLTRAARTRTALGAEATTVRRIDGTSPERLLLTVAGTLVRTGGRAGRPDTATHPSRRRGTP